MTSYKPCKRVDHPTDPCLQHNPQPIEQYGITKVRGKAYRRGICQSCKSLSELDRYHGLGIGHTFTGINHIGA